MQATKRVKDPRKQRKRHFNAPAHLRHKLMSAPLAPELISSKGAKSLPVRKGDTVRVMRGDHAGFEGKVNRVDLKGFRVFLEGLTREKVDGTNIFLSVHPSKVMIKNLKLDDKWRKRIVERKEELEQPTLEKKVEVVEKPPKKEPAVKPKKEKVEEKKVSIKEESKKKGTRAAKKKKAIAEKESKPKATRKPRAKRKTTSKTEGGT
jgi:large subunit ribosomal protein L24